MKLVNKKQKQKTIIIIAIIAVVVLAIVIGLIVGLSSNNKKTMKKDAVIEGINIASYPKTSYYVGETFDVSEILVQVVMSEQSATYFINANDPELTFSGFDSSVANDSLTIQVSYKGFTTSYNVVIKEKQTSVPVLQSIRLSDDFKTTYSISEWNNQNVFYGIKIICTYSNGSEKEIKFKYDYCYGLDKNLTSPGTTSFTIKYSESGVNVETTVTVTITN